MNDVPDDKHHRHYHGNAYEYDPGAIVPNDLPHAPTLRPKRRRHNRLCVPHFLVIECLGPKRESFYEQRLLENLPWFATQRATVNESGKQVCHFECILPWGEPKRFSMIGRHVLDSAGSPTTFEDMCLQIESDLKSEFCQCCANCHEMKCLTCTHAVGVYHCEKHGEQPRWKAGTLHNGKRDVEQSLYPLAERLVPVFEIEKKIKEYIEEGSLAEEDEEKYCALTANYSTKESVLAILMQICEIYSCRRQKAIISPCHQKN